MAGFYKAYFQAEATGELVETISRFGIYAKSIPFVVSMEAKEVPSNDWYDEHGEEDYIPSGGLYMKSYDMETEWAFKTCKIGGVTISANDAIKGFADMLRRMRHFKLYDTYNRVGRNRVRFVKISDDATLVRNADGDILIFKVTLKVCDPVSEVNAVFGGDGNVVELV